MNQQTCTSAYVLAASLWLATGCSRVMTTSSDVGWVVIHVRATPQPPEPRVSGGILCAEAAATFQRFGSLHRAFKAAGISYGLFGGYPPLSPGGLRNDSSDLEVMAARSGWTAGYKEKAVGRLIYLVSQLAAEYRSRAGITVTVSSDKPPQVVEGGPCGVVSDPRISAAVRQEEPNWREN